MRRASVRKTHFFVQPRAAPGGPRCTIKKLPADAPATVAALDGVHPAGRVATVRVVVAGKQIAELVKRQFLRVAQAGVVHLEFRPIEFAAVDCAVLRRVELAALGSGHRCAAVADTEVQPAIVADP